MAGCPTETIGRQVHRCDHSMVEVEVHHAHDISAGGLHGRTSIRLNMASGEADHVIKCAVWELTEAELHNLADLWLPRALELAGQLEPERNPHRDPGECIETIGVGSTSDRRALTGVSIHYGHEGRGPEHELTFIDLTYWRVGSNMEPGSSVLAVMLPGEVRDLIAKLHRAREAADPAAAR